MAALFSSQTNLSSSLVIHSYPVKLKKFSIRKSVNVAKKVSLFAVLVDNGKMKVPFKLKEGQSRKFHQLPSGLKMEVISQKGLDQKNNNELKNPPLVFIHGSYHAAWCWAEHWLPFFSENGFDCYALSLLAQGESDEPTGPAAGTLETHASDVASFIQKEITAPPVLLGHSFGGLIVQSYLSSVETNKEFSGTANSLPKLAGAILLCSVPPTGNGGLVWRYMRSKPIAAFKVTISLAAKGFATSLSLCKETFFSPELQDHLTRSYQKLMVESSRMPLFDLKKLNASLPVPRVPRSSFELLVLGASNDFIVDSEGLRETAMFYGVEPVCIEGIAHDMMLDCTWDKGAHVILSWLSNRFT
ncbi:hypothetical protein C5167_023193 [Papaver somniferum]|uniref:AB hydrolase-1 domain-containing protein n=1 Tax=Papaver somniferum TaxID=3469 RepID=A0A4Y7JNW5_PAPSO|nr:uncharacterized protein LOC113277652 isoform X1 [Papaver somniferum]RZC61429.1 hypothetical protein C5167_023193 [Papaver somniferum]